MSKPKTNEFSFSCRKPWGRIREEKIRDETYLDGEVVTPHGIVSVYSQGSCGCSHYTRLDTAINGRVYVRTIKRRYTRRGLVTLARRFAEELVEGV